MPEFSHPVSIRCVCGVSYDAPRWPSVTCPSCRHTWVLDPRSPARPIPHPGRKLSHQEAMEYVGAKYAPLFRRLAAEPD